MKHLFCLHGFSGAPEAWHAVLGAMPRDIEAVCPPLVGHDPAIPLTGDSFEHEVERLASALPLVVGERYHLVGYSLGGRLALGLLARHRKRFASATLIGTHPGLGGESERRERAAADDELASMLEREGVERFVDNWQSLPLFRGQRCLSPEILEAQRCWRLRHRPMGLAHALRVLSLGRMPDFRPELAKLDLPVHLMAGEYDEKFRRLAEVTARAMPRSTLDVVPAAGHNLILEAPAAVAAAILRATSAKQK